MKRLVIKHLISLLIANIILILVVLAITAIDVKDVEFYAGFFGGLIGVFFYFLILEKMDKWIGKL